MTGENVSLGDAAPPPDELSCPVCMLVLEHESGCPYFGLNMTEAWARFQARPHQAG